MTPNIGDVVDSEKSRIDRLVHTSDGKFASTIRWCKVNDMVTYHSKDPDETPDAAVGKLLSEQRVDGDTLFESLHDCMFVDERTAVNSTRGYDRHAYTEHTTKEWNKVRSTKGWESTVCYETGSSVPVRTKIIALPDDALADECSTYEEYSMKNKLAGNGKFMSERDFTVYKY